MKFRGPEALRDRQECLCHRQTEALPILCNPEMEWFPRDIRGYVRARNWRTPSPGTSASPECITQKTGVGGAFVAVRFLERESKIELPS
jgi:hypothetical protein